MWNYPGNDLADAQERSSLLDRFCSELGRDPQTITRSLVQPVDYGDPAETRAAVTRAVDAGFDHVVLSLPSPYPVDVAGWLAERIIG